MHAGDIAMSLALKVQPSQLVSLQDSKITTTSLVIAEAFKKQHKDVLRAIKTLDCSEDFASAQFCAYPYQHPQNKQTYTAYEITKDGFMFLVMGFTGKRAAQWKEAFINAFNAMAEKLAIDEKTQLAELEKQLAKLESKDTLTPEQQAHIQDIVINIAATDGIHYATTYRKIKAHFKVGTYKDIKSKDYPALCNFLGVKPRYTGNHEASSGCALSQQQLNEVDARLSSVMRIFHPFSDQFINLQCARRLLAGRDPATGMLM